MIDKLESKADIFIESVMNHPKWSLEDELMIQVLGFTLYGYLFGVGRLILFMDVEEINKVALTKLTSMGVGLKYTEGLIEAAHNAFTDGNDQSSYSQLVGIGHSHFASEDLAVCIESIINNTEALRQ